MMVTGEDGIKLSKDWWEDIKCADDQRMTDNIEQEVQNVDYMLTTNNYSDNERESQEQGCYNNCYIWTSSILDSRARAKILVPPDPVMDHPMTGYTFSKRMSSSLSVLWLCDFWFSLLH